MRRNSCLILFIVFFFLQTARIFGFDQSVVATKIIDNGADNRKKVFAVVSEGYAEADKPKFEADVNRIIVNGLLGNDFFLENRTAFNVYRVDLVSNESGVSTPALEKDTALRILYTNNWNRCWMEETHLTDTRLRRALNSVPRYDYVLIMVNESGFGGCRRGTRLYVTSGVNWDVVAHEYGHAIGNLYDEYWTENGIHPGNLPVNDRNCSTILDKNRVVWKNMLEAGMVIPPATESSPSLLPFTIGMFKGCNYKSDGIYRPSADCRMKSNTPEFCPVCLQIMKKAVTPYLNNPAPGGSGQVSQKYLSLLVEAKQSGDVQVLSAAEIETPLELNTETSGNYLFEVTRNGQTGEISFLTEDPFEVRSFSDPNNNRGEFVGRAETATFLINIPDVGYENVEKEKIGVKIHQLKSEIAVPENQTNIEKLDLLKKLKSNSVETLKLSSKELINDIKAIPKRFQF
jgi:hypothetical protein